MEQLKKFLDCLNSQLGTTNQTIEKKRLFLYCLIIFLIALSVKSLYWHDYASASVNNLNALAYDTEAERILEGKGILFPSQEPRPGDARLLVHPPGYSILVAISFTLFGNSLLPLTAIHQIFDSLAIIIIFLISLELLPMGIAIIGAFLAIFSPHFIYYSLNVSPESPSNLLLLLAAFFLIKTIKNFQLKYVIFAGLLIGLSCWLRPNALMLAPFLSIALLPFLAAKDRLRYLVTLIAITIVVILPITIRNFILFKQFIPISIGVGANLLEGIADYDLENKFGFPLDDQAVAQADVKIYNRPDYAGNQWSPDGLMREKNRVKRATDAIKSDPIWFFTVILKRVGFMLSYNDKGATRWPLSTAIVPILLAEPSFGHSIDNLDKEGKIVWSTTPLNLAKEGKTLTTQAKVSLENENTELVIIGDESNYGEQFLSPTISVKANTDYVLSLKILQQGQSAIKITSPDQRNIIATQIIRNSKTTIDDTNNITKIPFASGLRNEVKIILSNDGTSSPKTTIKQIELKQLGATPYTWTKPFRTIIRAIQKNIYNTKQMLPLLFLGTFLLILAKRKQILILLLAIPIYYFCFQSILHTEYRYIYLIHYFLFLISSVSIYLIAKILKIIFLTLKDKIYLKKFL
ncbi:MAG: glycosyltransferase family 39 protein [Acidobacteria bacterium]|nr:glycosyltransferase family 39 protein [Acidobacteriota bacterium]